MGHVFQLQDCGRIKTLFLSSCITHPGLNFASLKERQNCFVYSGFTGKPQECLLMDRIWKFLFTNETESYLFFHHAIIKLTPCQVSSGLLTDTWHSGSSCPRLLRSFQVPWVASLLQGVSKMSTPNGTTFQSYLAIF